MSICIFHGSRGSVKARVTQSRRKWYRMSNLRLMLVLRPSVRAYLIIISIRGMAFRYFKGRWLIDRTRGKELARCACHPLLRYSEWLPDECEVNLARTRVSLPFSRSPALPFSRSPLLTPSSFLCTGDRVIEIETNEWREVACYQEGSLCEAQADLSPSPRAFRSRPNCPFPAVNPKGFRSKGTRPGNT